MMTITVLPRGAMARAETFLAGAGWQGAPSHDEGDDASAAVAIATSGKPVMFVPTATNIPARLRRIVVVHKGTRGDRAGMDAANEAAVASGAEVIVLYFPSTIPSTTSASLPFRMADHGAHDWAEWRDEFLRRFCRCSEGVAVALRVGGPSAFDLR